MYIKYILYILRIYRYIFSWFQPVCFSNYSSMRGNLGCGGHLSFFACPATFEHPFYTWEIPRTQVLPPTIETLTHSSRLPCGKTESCDPGSSTNETLTQEHPLRKEATWRKWVDLHLLGTAMLVSVFGTSLWLGFWYLGPGLRSLSCGFFGKGSLQSSLVGGPPMVGSMAPAPDLSMTCVSRILSLLKPVKVASALVHLSLFNPKRPIERLKLVCRIWLDGIYFKYK